MTRTFGALGLLTILLTACGEGNNDEDVMTRNEAIASTARVSGDAATAIATCEAIGYDSDGDGVNDAYAFIIGQDGDGDTYPVVPTNLDDITADGEYGCVLDLLDGFVEITDDTEVGLDCDDTDAAINPDATEIADDGVDQDCDGADLESDPDSDGDGYVASLDCDDTDAAINPDATEVCDEVDNNCDGTVDEDSATDAPTWYADSDGDGFGDPDSYQAACNQPSGFIADDTDCDDTDGDINPDAIEICDSVDNDCDGDIDDGDEDVIAILGGDEYYFDDDGDGFGDPAYGKYYCDGDVAEADGFGTDDTDCDDGDATIYPGATEIPDDTIDQDCDDGDATTTTATDADGDGFDSEASGGTDCDDGDASINPDAEEISLDGVDNNCDDLANTEDDVEICATPVSGLMSYDWQLWVRDGTVDSDGSSTPDTWGIGNLEQGTGELCGNVQLVDGNTEIINGPFDIDGDGVFCSDIDGDGVVETCDDSVWGYMLTEANLDEVTANGLTISVTNTSWGSGSDGKWTVDLL